MTSATETLPVPRRPQPLIPNGQLGTLLLMGSETVLFACFMSAYMVLRMSAPAWPPIGTPRLQIGLSVLNTAVLLLSMITIVLYSRTVKQPGQSRANGWLTATLALGSLFLILQGVEFQRLYARGLTLQTGPYGAVFYCLISLHGLHVLGGLGFLSYLWVGKQNVIERAADSALYWGFVTVVWLVLFSILYVL